jgi:molybdopterin converting factor small subunit
MQIKIRLMGIFKEANGLREVTLDIPEYSTVGSAIQTLIGDDKSFGSLIWDLNVDSPSPKALIMLDGVEISNLQGKETPIKPDQELVLLSVVHGG